MARGHREAADVVGDAARDRRDEVGQARCWLALALGDLLAQGVQAGELGLRALVG